MLNESAYSIMPTMFSAINGSLEDAEGVNCPWREEYRSRQSDLIRRWKTVGIFIDEDLDDINCYWLKFEPAPLIAHLGLVILFLIVFLVGCSSNALVVYILSTTRHLQTPANIIITNLAISDFIMLAKIPLFIYNSLVQGPALGYRGCQAYGFLSGLTGCTSIMSLAAVAFERYLVISRPLQARKPTRAGACFAVFFIWVYSAIFASLPLFGIGKYVPEGYLTSCSFDYLSEDDATRVFILAFFVAAWVIPLTVIASCYTAIVRYVYLAKREISSLHDTARDGQVIAQPGCQNSRGRCQPVNIEYKFAIIIFGLVVLWLLSWTPYAFVALMGISGNEARLTPGMTMLPALFAKMSACVNSFVYSLNHPKIRKEVSKRCCKRKSESSSRRLANTAGQQQGGSVLNTRSASHHLGDATHGDDNTSFRVQAKSRPIIKPHPEVLAGNVRPLMSPVIPSSEQLSGVVNGHRLHRPQKRQLRVVNNVKSPSSSGTFQLNNVVVPASNICRPESIGSLSGADSVVEISTSAQVYICPRQDNISVTHTGKIQQCNEDPINLTGMINEETICYAIPFVDEE